ncbi:MAG TPA: flagellar motor stator protein MotA [Gammaproteobacteria bacterium]|nr:flagellar motor stator protein MotA [Gammaproteobacteria bacterium]
MNVIIGLTMVIACVFGGFMLSGGSLLALWHPPELIIIAGGALGALILANPTKVIKTIAADLPGIIKGSKYDKAMYMDLLALMFDLFSIARKEGLMSLEAHIEEPENSQVFVKYPNILSDHHAIEFLTDYLRLMVTGAANAMEMENLMDMELETHHSEAAVPSSAVTTMADGLPGFGIVAAVMGVVITMASIDQGPAVIGEKVGAALVGTFVGILLSYGIAGPISSAMRHIKTDEAKFIEVIKVSLLASLNGYSPQVAVEFGRKVIFSSERPTFIELEDHVKRK